MLGYGFQADPGVRVISGGKKGREDWFRKNGTGEESAVSNVSPIPVDVSSPTKRNTFVTDRVNRTISDTAFFLIKNKYIYYREPTYILSFPWLSGCCL